MEEAGANGFLTKPLAMKHMTPYLLEYLRFEKKNDKEETMKPVLPENLRSQVQVQFERTQKIPYFRASQMIDPLDQSWK